MTADIKVGGFTPFTTIDFPNHIACVVFMQGCPWKCPYCHNPALIPFDSIESNVSWEEILAFLDTRVNLLEGVVFSGGEPIAQKGLKNAIEEVRKKGFFVALHTNGYNPEVIEEILPLLSWVGLDIKLPFSKYNKRIGKGADGNKVAASLAAVIKSGMKFEVRTTLDPRIIRKVDVLEIAEMLAQNGVENYALQQYRCGENERNVPTIPEILQFFNDEEFLSKLRALIPNVILRAE